MRICPPGVAAPLCAALLAPGVYLPAAWKARGHYYLSGAKTRLKWLPLRPADGEAGWYADANFELPNLRRRYSETRGAAELRMIGGYRTEKSLKRGPPKQ